MPKESAPGAWTTPEGQLPTIHPATSALSSPHRICRAWQTQLHGEYLCSTRTRVPLTTTNAAIGTLAATDTDGQTSQFADSTCRSGDNRTVNETASGVSHPHRQRLLSVGVLLSAALQWSTPLAAAAPTEPGQARGISIGTVQMPTASPSGGGSDM
ncbi:hypothetical protein BBP13_12310 [Limosilactobacillus reuteri]|nr:hypothetical protein BBP13_12310 [Limosilactobacillus reuteri]